MRKWHLLHLIAEDDGAGVVRKVWSDHADIRPTLLALVGLQDDYVHDGLPLSEFTSSRGSDSVARSEAALLQAAERTGRGVRVGRGPAYHAGDQGSRPGRRRADRPLA
jgi:hypothetical protein